MSDASVCGPDSGTLCGLSFPSEINLQDNVRELHIKEYASCMYCSDRFIDQESAINMLLRYMKVAIINVLSVKSLSAKREI